MLTFPCYVLTITDADSGYHNYIAPTLAQVSELIKDWETEPVTNIQVQRCASVDEMNMTLI